MNNNQNQSRLQDIKVVVESLPIFYKFVGACTIVTGVFSMFFNLFANIFANFPFYTLFYVNIWRLFTSFFVAEGLIAAIFSLFVLWFILPLIERNVSTVMITVDVMVNNAAIQVLYVLIWLLVYLINQQYAKDLGLMGVWGVWIVLLTRICESDPYGKIKFCGLAFTVQKKIYPFIMIALYAILTFSLPLQLILGYLVGFAQCKYLNGTLIRLSSQQYQKLQNSFLFRCINHRFDFIRLTEANYAQSFSRESHSTYVQFYGNVVGKIVSGADTQQQSQQNYNIADNVGSSNFDSLQGGVPIGQTKSEQISQSITVQKPLHLSPIKPNTNSPSGYAAFEDQN